MKRIPNSPFIGYKPANSSSGLHPHLMGLSDGGLKVSRAASPEGLKYRSLIFLSPVFDREEIRTALFYRENENHSVLVLTGESDDRIPIGYVRDGRSVPLKPSDNPDVSFRIMG